MKKNMVIIAARGIGDLIFHLPLLRSLYESYEEKHVSNAFSTVSTR